VLQSEAFHEKLAQPWRIWVIHHDLGYMNPRFVIWKRLGCSAKTVESVASSILKPKEPFPVAPKPNQRRDNHE
jgi:hypothetical protein